MSILAVQKQIGRISANDNPALETANIHYESDGE